MKVGYWKLLLLALLLSSCASYKYAHKVKMISFSDNLKKGKSVGPVRGQDCTWHILGYYMGELPTVDVAFINAKNQAGKSESSGMGVDRGERGQRLRYLNNVEAENTGFNTGLFGKKCITVTGNGYR